MHQASAPNLPQAPNRRRLPTFLLALILYQLSSAPAQAAETQSSWQAEWNNTVQQAKQEGQVNVYLWGSTAVLDEGVFQAAYPEIKVSAVSGTGGQLLQRILS